MAFLSWYVLYQHSPLQFNKVQNSQPQPLPVRGSSGLLEYGGAGGQGLGGVSCIHVPTENNTGVNCFKSNCQSHPSSPPAFVKCYEVARGFTRARVQVGSARDGVLCAESLSHRRGWKLQRYRAKTGRQMTMQEEIQLLRTLLEKKKVHDGNFKSLDSKLVQVNHVYSKLLGTKVPLKFTGF